jgi:hypothetical protein
VFDHQFELRRLLDRQIGGLRSIENLRSITAELSVSVEIVGSVAHKSPSGGVCTPVVDRRDCMASRQSDELIAPAVEQSVVAQDQCGVAQIDECDEGGIYFGLAAGIQDLKLLPN